MVPGLGEGLGAGGGGGEGPSSAATSTSVNLTTGSFGQADGWSSMLPLLVLGVVAILLVKKG